MPAPNHSVFTGQMLFLLLNQQRQSTEGNVNITHTHPFNGPFSGTTQVSRYQKGKTNLDFTEARDSAWQWHQLGHMQVCTSHQTDNHASTSPLSFLQAGCPSCRPTNSVKALKANSNVNINGVFIIQSIITKHLMYCVHLWIVKRLVFASQ